MNAKEWTAVSVAAMAGAAIGAYYVYGTLDDTIWQPCSTAKCSVYISAKTESGKCTVTNVSPHRLRATEKGAILVWKFEDTTSGYRFCKRADGSDDGPVLKETDPYNQFEEKCRTSQGDDSCVATDDCTTKYRMKSKGTTIKKYEYKIYFHDTANGNAECIIDPWVRNG
ncbi:MAG TPA: hypothetical protein VNB03_01850 [Casimicrobiaceae bacterium]|jgi:hypothetical protein|nr:hypothetical protein [Casimicrobiaceae bacterium]